MFMNFIRKIVGTISRPPVLFVLFQDEADCYQVESESLPDWSWRRNLKYPIKGSDGVIIHVYYRYQYTRIKQNFWGCWIPETCYLGRHFECYR